MNLFTLILVPTLCLSSPFGHEMLKQFMMANYTNLNHGSFGCSPKSVIEAQQNFVAECEANPDRWIGGGYDVYLAPIRQRLAAYPNADSNDLVFVENASSGINAVFRSLKLAVGDVVLQLSTAYGMNRNVLSWLVGMSGIQIETIPIIFNGNKTIPTSLNGISISDAITQAIQKYGNKLKIASFDSISSSPATIWPFLEYATLCKRAGVRVIIDGAHSLGHINVNLTLYEENGIDYWVGNGHKWLYSPKGTCMLWVTKKYQSEVVPTVISTIDPITQPFGQRFRYTGTRDYTPFTSIGSAMDFRDLYGGDATINPYCYNLALWAQNYLSTLWKTEIMLPDNMTGFMANIRMPTNDPIMAGTISQRLADEYRIQTAGYAYTNIETNITSFWFRLSTQIYLEEEDFKRIGQAVIEILG